MASNKYARNSEISGARTEGVCVCVCMEESKVSWLRSLREAGDLKAVRGW